MVWTDQEKAFAVLTFNKTGSFKETAIKFRKQFKTRKSPAKSRIQDWLKKSYDNGSVYKYNKGKSSSKRTVRSEANVAVLQVSADTSPETSLRRRVLAENLTMSHESVRRILTYDLSLKAYIVQMAHVLTPRDMKRRTVMAKEFLRRMTENPAWINDVWFTDETHCYLSGRVNKTHCIFWESSKPDYVLERPLHSVKCTVWMAISARGVIGPFFFEDDLGKAQTVTSSRYLTVVKKFVARLRR